MKSFLALVVGAMALGGVAQAQTPAPASSGPFKGYIEGVAQAAFGNVTSQSYGAEAGYKLKPNILVFLEGGLTRNVATSTTSTAAKQIADYLSGIAAQPNVSYSVKQPVGFGDIGIRYVLPMDLGKLTPYVVGAAGIARVKQDVIFRINGTDVTTTMQNYGVTLGSDLAGQETKALVNVGGGVEWPIMRPLVLDLQFRYGRILTSPGINMSRAGIGFGVRF